MLFAFLAHAFFFYEWTNDRFMVGPNDGMAQMLPFKYFLYEQYKIGEFFYSLQFGLGGGIYSQLAYYFSTSTVFFLTFLVVFLGEFVGLFQDIDTVFWGQAAVFVNAIRLAAVLLISTYVFRYIKIKWPYAFLAACLYGASVMYFRHASFWEFFADAYLWLPLLVLGVEKLIRENKPFWLILAMSLSLINNFYFAYMNFIFIAIYALLRWVIRLPEDRLSIPKQVKSYIPIVLLSFAIGAISFIPAVYGYLSNHRPPFTDEIELFDLHDNILYASRLFLLPALFVFFAFIKRLYQDRTFVLFACLGFLFIVFHYSPFIGSAFNGFSAPQFRFEYMGSFAVAGAVGVGLQMLKSVPRKQLVTGLAAMLLLYALVYLMDDFSLSVLNPALAFFAWALTVVVGVLLLWLGTAKPAMITLVTTTLVFQLIAANVGQKEFLSENGNLQDSTRAFMESEDYNEDEQRSLIHAALEENEDPLARVEWVADYRNNTPLVQDFYGNSAYSSVLNDQLLFLYYHDLEIDMGRESVSRYSGFGDRANLHSMLQVRYKLVAKDSDDPIPYGFTLHSENETYELYENENVLPFARTTSTVYSKEDLEEVSPLTREHAMLDGMISSNERATSTLEDPPDLMEQAEIEAVGGTYENGTLEVTEEKGGIDIILGERDDAVQDDYLSFFLLNNSETAPLFSLKVNEFKTSRKSLESIYRTNVNDITIRVESSDILSLRVPEGSYTLTDLELYSETYDPLQQAVQEGSEEPIETSVDGGEIRLQYDNTTDDTHVVLPVPFEKGWEVEVNGEKQPVEQLNYAFLGTQLVPGENDITFSYLPPYFRLSLSLTVVGLLATGGWAYYRRRKTPRSRS